MQSFEYNALPGRVVFGRGTVANVKAEVEALGASQALVITTAQQESSGAVLLEKLGDCGAGIFAGAVMHTPVNVTEAALEFAADLGVDCLVAVGGGSTIGLAKAIALRTDLPQIAIPTTYAGSEATPILGQTEDGIKTTQRGMEILPETIIYDVELTLTLPVGLTVTSGLNAIAHSIEGLYARDSNPIISMIAEEGIRALVSALPRIVEEPSNVDARSDALYGSWGCGVTLGAVGMALHHKLCHVLGGTFDLPHSETHSVILPHAMAYNAAHAPEAMMRAARAIGDDNAPLGIWELSRSLGAPLTLEEIGMPADCIEQVVQLVLENPYWNPAPLEAQRLRTLLQNAYSGLPPNSA